MAQPGPPLPLKERLFLYGIKAIVVVLGFVALGVFLAVYGWLSARYDYIASGAIIVIIGVVVGVAAAKTSYTLITKPYFNADSMVGKTGKALGPIKAHAKGVVHIEHEQWSAVAEEDIGRGDWVAVTAVEPDKVTVRVRRHTP